MQQHQPHEAFFSFTVPPKPTLLHQQQSSPHLLTSIVTDLDCHRSHLDLSSRSPLSASPTGTSSARPGTAGPFAFNVPSGTPSTTPSSSATRLSPNHPPTSASSLAPSLDRPFSSSGLSLTNNFPPSLTNNNPQTPSSSHAITTHDLQKAGPRSGYPHLAISNPSRSAHPSPLPAPAQMSNCSAVNLHHSRPMTAPGSAWVGNQHLGDGLDFSSAHAGLFGQAAPTYPLQPTSLSASSLSKTPSADFSSSIRHLTHSSPGPSSVHTGGALDPITHLTHGSSSGSSDPDSILHEYAVQSTSPVRGASAIGRPSLGAHSTESTPDSPDSSDVDHSHSLGYIHTMPPSNIYHPLRPNTHSGTSTSFGHGDRFVGQPSQPRPTTGYPQLYDPNSAYSSIHPQAHHYGPRPPMFSTTHSSQIYATGSGQYSHGPGSLESHGQERLYNFNILPGAPRKRARRRFDEVERLYDCNYPGCTKAYGTLNHLNAHIAMQKHGAKRLPQEFKEIRKEWRARKKAEAEARATALKQSANNNLSASHEYNVLNGQDCFRRHKVGGGVSNDSSPSGSSTSGGFAHNTMRSPAVGESYSAPAQSTHFVLNTTGDRHSNDWFNNDHRLNGTAIDEQPEYSVPHHQPTSSSSTSTQLSQPVPIDTLTHNLFGSHPRFMPNPNPPTPAHSQSHSNSNTLLHNHHHHSNNGIVGVSSHHLINRPAHILLNHSAAASIVDHS
ncbi:hypothetical protein MJO28_014020 [Puccinia striiformis f. sp. tritici]|uniref:C2H2-type domain-containing protein n=2 Tax=Puccinia striiformis TaxID=27350 RepID=A0A2S4UDN6_9BASI|nr:hypothetical protein MJO28_014020 [Puccinia striiformis f. sp. tritici]POV95398.1 hypothetical protein PSHT_15684 [Puccinia striiformis]